MKSIATLSPHASGMGSGCKGPVGLHVDDLFHRHSVQDGIYAFSRLRCMLGQKYASQRVAYDLSAPKCPELSCASLNKSSLIVPWRGISKRSLMYKRPLAVWMPCVDGE